MAVFRRASKIIDEMFELCTRKIKKEQRESELQAILMSYAIEHEMFDTGYKSTLNPLIIAGGPNYIKNQKYGKYFIHSTGHGIGLEVHELPNISPKSTAKLAKNMAITVEPGIYIPKKLGVRIEDSLIVQDRPILLHKFTKDLIKI